MEGPVQLFQVIATSEPLRPAPHGLHGEYGGCPGVSSARSASGPFFSRVHDHDIVEHGSTVNGPEHVGLADVEGDFRLEDRVSILVADLVLVNGPQDEP